MNYLPRSLRSKFTRCWPTIQEFRLNLFELASYALMYELDGLATVPTVVTLTFPAVPAKIKLILFPTPSMLTLVITLAGIIRVFANAGLAVGFTPTA